MMVQEGNSSMTTSEQLLTLKLPNKLLDILDLIDIICDSDDDDDESHLLDSTLNYINNKMCISKVSNKSEYEPPIKKKLVDVSNPMRGLKDADNPLEYDTDNEFQSKYHLSKETVQEILHMILYGLHKVTNRGQPISPLMELLITLKFMVAGTFQTKTEDKISQPSVSRLIRRITALLADLKLRFVKFPDKVEARKLSDRFKFSGGFPEVVGCLGNIHVGVKSPGKALADSYLNENGFYSLRVQLICGPNLEFIDVISRWPGASNENKIFNVSEVKHRFEYQQVEGVLLADNNYAPSSYVMTPIQEPRSIPEWKYNEAHRNTYNVKEAVDQLKKRFRCLQTVLNTREDTTQNIITSCVVLHNIARLRNDILPVEEACIPIQATKGKENMNRKIPHYIGDMNEPLGLLDRDAFVNRHFVNSL